MVLLFGRLQPCDVMYGPANRFQEQGAVDQIMTIGLKKWLCRWVKRGDGES